MGKTRRHGNRVSGQGARLIDGAERCHLLHQLPAAAVGANRHTAADNFAIGHKIGTDTIVLLGAAGCQTEAGNDLVKNEKRAAFVTQLSQALQKAGLGRNNAHVCGNRLHNHRRHLTGIGLQQGCHTTQVIVIRRQGISGNFRRNARRVGSAAGQRAGAGFHQHGIGVPVVAARELDDLASSRRATGKPQGGHHRFSAGIDHAHHLGAGHFAHQLGHFNLHRRRRAEAQAFADGLADRPLHRFITVSQNQRAPGADEIDVFLSVHVPHVAAKAPVQKPGIGAHAAAGPHRGIDAAGHDLLSRFK